MTVEGAPTAEALRELGGRKVGSTRSGARFEMTLTGGKNREIRRASAQHGLRVVELQRVAFGPIELGRLGERTCIVCWMHAKFVLWRTSPT